jgi:hypothetical protein
MCPKIIIIFCNNITNLVSKGHAEASSLLETFLGVSVVLVTNRAPLPINKRYRKE